MIQIAKGTCLIQEEQPLDSLCILLEGTVRMEAGAFQMQLQKGDILGLADLAWESHSASYTALEDCRLVEYPYHGAPDLTAFFTEHIRYRHFFLFSAARLCREAFDYYVLFYHNSAGLYELLTDSYQEYRSLCTRLQISPKALPALEQLAPLTLEEEVPDWRIAFYDRLSAIPPQKLLPFDDPAILTGFLMNLSRDIRTVRDICLEIEDYRQKTMKLLLSENRMDFLDLYQHLYERACRMGEDTDSLSASISRLFLRIEGSPSVDQELLRARQEEYRETCRRLAETPQQQLKEQPDESVREALRGSLEQILSYARCPDDLAQEFTGCIDRYRAMLDKNATDDASRKLRQKLARLFLEVYRLAFFRSLDDDRPPVVVRMLFLYGYVDEDLAGAENAAWLYQEAQKPTPREAAQPPASSGAYTPDTEAHTPCVYTFYDWLTALYRGEKMPSRNEFDTDFEQSLREQRVAGKITAEQERRMAADMRERVAFELDNLFPVVNKVTFGRLSTYCPVFSEHNVLKSLEECMVRPEQVAETMRLIRRSDYGAFCRESFLSRPDLGIGKEPYPVEVLPDVILMPNVGSRGVMWQEIEGKKRSTPSRMMLPLFFPEDLRQALIRLTGEYRWEMCKRVQGAHWNDVSDRSLTSEYFDYAQFFRRSRDLSADAKEKLKNSLQKARGSYKELFVQDYLTWILYEGTGAPRLNKVARQLLFTYCPFSREVREQLRANPIYQEVLERYETRTGQKKHHLDMVLQKLRHQQIPVPPELQSQYDFLNG